MTEKIIEFECKYWTANLKGFAYADELDSDEPLYFYDETLQPQSHLGNAAIDGAEEDKQKLLKAFTEDIQFIQFLADFENENITIDRGNYTLVINGGTQLEMTVEKNDEWDRLGTYLNAKISFKFGDTILGDDLMEELCDLIATTWNDSQTYKPIYGENAICLIIDENWWDDETYGYLYGIENKKAVEKEMISDAETLFLRQVIMDKGVYSTYCEKYYVYHGHSLAGSRFDAANNYEQILETMLLEEVNNICEEELVERIRENIRGEV